MNRINQTCFTLFAYAIAIAFSSTAYAETKDLLSKVSSGDSLSVTPPNHATDIVPTKVDVEMLLSLTVDDNFQLQLYGQSLTAVVDEYKPQIEGATVVGHFKKTRNSRFVISVVNNAVAGTFFLPNGDSNVRLRYGGPNGLHYLHKINSNQLRPCAESEVTKQIRGKDHRDSIKNLKQRITEIQNQPLTRFMRGADCGASDPTFDVMIAYTNLARTDAGSTSAIRAEAINAVSITELTYLTCNILLRTRIVGLVEVAYNENGNYENHLDRLTDTGDGILDSVHTTRNAVAADFVSLFVTDDESGGLGWCLAGQDEAFCIVRWEQAAEGFTLAHEIGHNIGCAHNPEDADCEPTEIGYGHNFFVPSEGKWRNSVMAYSRNGSSRIPWYSNPSCFYEGVPTGTPDRDNLAVIFARQYICEAFRQTRMEVWVDFGYGGSETGSNSRPFNTANEGVSHILADPIVDIPTLKFKPGSRSEAVTFDKPMFALACGGTVTIGQ